jgi:hypothetical protein
MPTKTWPKPPPPAPQDGTFVDDVSEIPMVNRGPNGAAPTYNSPRIETTLCKHGKGSCEACGTSNRRDTVHTTKGGLGAVGKLRKRR